MLLVYGIIIVTVVLFVTERLRLDVVALLALLALLLTGILTPPEALAGFSDPVVLMIAALFVVGDGLFQTGVAQAMGRWPQKLAGDSEVRLLVVIMLLVALLSGFMSSTGTVAVMLPVVVGLAWARDMSPSKLLIPLSVASLLGGMLTLIGTPPNLVVSAHLESMGRDPFGFFAFTPIGLPILVVGIAFMAFVGIRLLPDRTAPGSPQRDQDTPSVEEMAGSWTLHPQLFRVKVREGSRIEGKKLRDVNLPDRFGVTVLEILKGRPRNGRPRAGGRIAGRVAKAVPRVSERMAKAVPRVSGKGEPPAPEPALADAVLQVGQELLVEGDLAGMNRMVQRGYIDLLDDDVKGDPLARETGIAEVLLTPRSRLVGRTLRKIRFRDRYQLSVVGIKRMGEKVRGDLRDLPLEFGDMLLVQGPWDRIRMLQQEGRDFVVAMAPREMEPALKPLDRAPVAVLVMLGMLLLMTFNIVPAVTAVLLAAVAMVLFGAVSAADAYRAVNWESVVLIAGILPMATALEKTGGMQLIVDGIAGVMEGATPVILLVVLFLLTSVLSQVISNTATAVLLAPIAFQLAVGIGANPEPFLMTIAVAASTAFATPVASPVNTLVLGPGGYKFGDFFKVGVALQVLVLIVAAILIPLLFPF
ncbi:MAG: SLC13 family permease [Gemmatimonadales bacterium]|nr:MAG: SLC13 family permease [Gemmatimonadales bacterium]